LTFDALAVPLIPLKIVFWQRLSFLSIALLPTPWLLFSLFFARGDYSEINSRSGLALICGCIVPVAVVVMAWKELVFPIPGGIQFDGLRLGWAGKALQVWLLVGAVAILANLERTFRSSVGTIRWKIKFMLI